jgi:hypothetical protein
MQLIHLSKFAKSVAFYLVPIQLSNLATSERNSPLFVMLAIPSYRNL